MYSALYYPHAELSDESIIKTGLLLWDKLDYICPYKGYSQYNQSLDISAALELILTPHLPSNEEKILVHKEVEKLVQTKLPDWFIFIPKNPELSYRIYPQKMLDKTWQLLLNSNLVKNSKKYDSKDHWSTGSDYIMSSSLGLTLMSILADCCAGSQKRLITDEVDSYSALTRYITQINEGEYVGLKELKAPKIPLTKPHYEKLITVSFKALNLDGIDIKKLILLREREVKENDTLLRELRRNYFTKLDGYVKQLSEDARHEGDCKEILRTFETEAEDDLLNLKRELKLNAKKTLLSKEVFGTIVTTSLSVIEPISTSIIGVGLLGKTLVDYRANKRKVLEGRSMSWLYMTKPSKIF